MESHLQSRRIPFAFLFGATLIGASLLASDAAAQPTWQSAERDTREVVTNAADARQPNRPAGEREEAVTRQEDYEDDALAWQSAWFDTQELRLNAADGRAPN